MNGQGIPSSSRDGQESTISNNAQRAILTMRPCEHWPLNGSASYFVAGKKELPTMRTDTSPRSSSGAPHSYWPWGNPVKSLWTLGGSHRERRQKTLDKLTQMSRTTRKSCRPRVSDRIIVGTLANASACEASGPEGVEPSRHETLEWKPSTGLVSLEYLAISRQPRQKILRDRDGAGCKGQHLCPLGGDREHFFLDIPSYRITYALW